MIILIILHLLFILRINLYAYNLMRITNVFKKYYIDKEHSSVIIDYVYRGYYHMRTFFIVSGLHDTTLKAKRTLGSTLARHNVNPRLRKQERV